MSNYAIYEDGSKEIEVQVTDFISKLAHERIEKCGHFILGLSGGSLVNFLTRLKFPERVQMSKWHIFMVDERAVPVNHPDSNCGTLKAAWIDAACCNWHMVSFTDSADENEVDEASRMYESEIKRTFDAIGTDSFDLLLLGLGPDGHTASLFPSHPDFLNNISSNNTVIPVRNSPKPPNLRISLSPKAIQSAKSSVFIITGSAGKASVIKSILIDRDALYPPVIVAPNSQWFLDKTSGSCLLLL